MTSANNTSVTIVETGCANTASMSAALQRLGTPVQPATRPSDIVEATHVVVPGVGSFASGMEALRRNDWVDALRSRIDRSAPTLAICLGLQLLFESSDEAAGIEGIGAFKGRVAPLRAPGLPLPQMGWNRVSPTDDCEFIQPGWAFFANGFAVQSRPATRTATARYGAEFVAAFERGGVLACQFHPELSGPWGLSLLRRWLVGTNPECARVEGVPTRLIPCLDVRGSRVVKGVQFANLRDAGDPLELATAYEDQGADELVVLDISATPEDRGHAVDTVARLRPRLSIPLTVGGGIRTVEDARRLLEVGADKVAINTAAVRNPEILTDLTREFGRQCVVLSLDAQRSAGAWTVRVESGREDARIDAVSWAAEAERLGAGEILLTSFDRDGTQSGYDLDLIQAVRTATSLPIVASGGAATAAHMFDAVQAGASAVLAASIFHDGDETVTSIKRSLVSSGLEVRS